MIPGGRQLGEVLRAEAPRLALCGGLLAAGAAVLSSPGLLFPPGAAFLAFEGKVWFALACSYLCGVTVAALLAGRRHYGGLRNFLVVCDLFFLGLLVRLSGGAASPLVPLYFVAAALFGILADDGGRPDPIAGMGLEPRKRHDEDRLERASLLSDASEGRWRPSPWFALALPAWALSWTASGAGGDWDAARAWIGLAALCSCGPLAAVLVHGRATSVLRWQQELHLAALSDLRSAIHDLRSSGAGAQDRDSGKSRIENRASSEEAEAIRRAIVDLLGRSPGGLGEVHLEEELRGAWEEAKGGRPDAPQMISKFDPPDSRRLRAGVGPVMRFAFREVLRHALEGCSGKRLVKVFVRGDVQINQVDVTLISDLDAEVCQPAPPEEFLLCSSCRRQVLRLYRPRWFADHALVCNDCFEARLRRFMASCWRPAPEGEPGLFLARQLLERYQAGRTDCGLQNWKTREVFFRMVVPDDLVRELRGSRESKVEGRG